MKKLLYFLLFMLIFINIVKPAQAGAIFEQSPLSNDIVALTKDPDGNIIAIDRCGRVAKFNYYYWQLLWGNQGGWWYCSYVDGYKIVLSGQYVRVYNSQTNSYEANIYSDYYGLSYAFLRNGVLYRVFYSGNDRSYGKPLLYMWNGSSWVLIAQGPEDSIYCPCGRVFGFYERSSDSLYVLFGQNGSPWASVWRFYFSNNQWQMLSNSFYTSLYSITAKNGAMLVSNYYSGSYRIYLNDISNPIMANNNQPGYCFSTPEQDIIGAGMQGSLYLYPIGVVASSLSFTPTAIAYDKYGNLFIGGSNGKVIVRDLNGGFHNDTAFYTDIVINFDIRPNVNNAVNAAIQARDVANAVSSAVKDANGTVLTAARNAANNTWYNGQSAAYWAYLAAQNASPPTITKVQGQNGATCTAGSTFTVVISTAPSSGVQYRVTCGSFDSGWVSSNTITITSGIVSGANTATVQVKNAAGAVAQTTFTFFKV